MTLGIEHEKPSKDRLLWHLASQDEVITVDDHELLTFVEIAQRADSPQMIARRMTANLRSGDLGDRDVIEHVLYKLKAI